MDLDDPDFMECPFPQYRRLRETEPIAYLPDRDFYIATRHDIVKHILTTPEDFRQWTGDEMYEVGEGPPLGNPKYWSPEVAAVMADSVRPVSTLVTANPPRHASYRAVANSVFSARRTAQALSGKIQDFIDELIDSFPTSGRVDLMAEFAAKLPPMIVADVLAVPPSDYVRFAGWAEAALLIANGRRVDPAEMIEYAKAVVDLQGYLARLLREREGEPGEDLVTYLANSELTDADGHKRALTIEERVGILVHFLTGGTETTAGLIASMVLQVLSNPTIAARVAADPKATALKVVEETLRAESPQQAMFRRTTRPLELAGVQLPENARVIVSFGAANRDEDVFQEPDVFDPWRSDVGAHLAFGHGAHFCLGAPLARREASMALVALFERLPGLRLAESSQPQRKPNPFQRTFVELEVEYDAILPAARTDARRDAAQ